ncbi:MAG: C40 family peptidase [Blastocatellia bacterium]
MKTAFRLLLCVFSFAPMVFVVSLTAKAQIRMDVLTRPASEESALHAPQLPKAEFVNLTSLVLPAFRPPFLTPPLLFSTEKSAALYQAINQKLGIRYRFFGVDDRGYDCSGFVWRVFQDVGADFQRVAARTLWNELPEARPEETTEFGTLVFFNNLKHIGIVRDAETFYHSSRSEGVTLSKFAGYWESRIIGYRRAPAALIESLPKPPRISSGMTCE